MQPSKPPCRPTRMKNGTGRPAGLIPGFKGLARSPPAIRPARGRAWSRLRAWWERGGGSLASPGMRWPLAASAVLCLTVGSFLTGRGSVRSPVKTVVLTVQAPAGHQPDGNPGNLATGPMYSAVRPSSVASEKPVAAEDSGKVASPPERLATAQSPPAAPAETMAEIRSAQAAGQPVTAVSSGAASPPTVRSDSVPAQALADARPVLRAAPSQHAVAPALMPRSLEPPAAGPARRLPENSR